MSEDVRRLPKNFEEDPKTFRWYTNEFKYNMRDKPDVSEIIDIFTCENIISSHVRISYRFYQFVTTRYTTDFYIINFFRANFEVTPQRIVTTHQLTNRVQPPLVLRQWNQEFYSFVHIITKTVLFRLTVTKILIWKQCWVGAKWVNLFCVQVCQSNKTRQRIFGRCCGDRSLYLSNVN